MIDKYEVHYSPMHLYMLQYKLETLGFRILLAQTEIPIYTSGNCNSDLYWNLKKYE